MPVSLADGEDIVEIMRHHAARELADRLHLLRRPQRFFGDRPLVHLRIETLRPTRDCEQREEEQNRRRYSKDQVRRHLPDPFAANGGGRDSGLDIERRAVEATHGVPASDPINDRFCSV